MNRQRIRWRNVARVAAITLAAAVAVLVLPGLLTPPEPEPLPEDIGVLPPESASDPRAAVLEHHRNEAARAPKEGKPVKEPGGAGGENRRAVQGPDRTHNGRHDGDGRTSRHHRDRRGPLPSAPPTTASPTQPSYIPPPAPAPPPPPPAPPAPGEFGP